MSKPFTSVASLRQALPCIASSSSSSSCIASSSSRPFSTTPTPLKPSSERRYTRLRLKREASRPKVLERVGPDYALGLIRHFPDDRGRLPNNPIVKDPWPGCRLARTIVHPKDVWDSPLTNYEMGERPQRLLPGLSDADSDLIFGAVPMVSTQLGVDVEGKTGDRRARDLVAEGTAQVKQTEMMMRILDLRNADRATINAYNRQRIIAEFGGNDKGTDTGSSFVQVALLTLRIRNMNEHVLASKKDVDSRRAMRNAIFDRARHLKYIRRKYPTKYDQLLVDIGVDPSTVEGELITRL